MLTWQSTSATQTYLKTHWVNKPTSFTDHIGILFYKMREDTLLVTFYTMLKSKPWDLNTVYFWKVPENASRR